MANRKAAALTLDTGNLDAATLILEQVASVLEVTWEAMDDGPQKISIEVARQLLEKADYLLVPPSKS